MKVQLLAALAATMGAANLVAGPYQTVRISNVDEVLAQYTATTNGMAKNKIPFVIGRCGLLFFGLWFPRRILTQRTI